MRALDELVNVADPAWPTVQRWLSEARNVACVLPTDEVRRQRALHDAQITTRSPMGAIIYETGGILVDDGWLRLLGSGSQRQPRSLPDWNRDKSNVAAGAPPPFLLVADDVVGGFFAIDGGGLGGPRGTVQYFAPDTLRWERHTPSFSDFVLFALQGDLERFYAGSRWTGWRDEVGRLGGDEAVSIYPFLWAAGPPVSDRSRRTVPISELWAIQQELATRMNGH